MLFTASAWPGIADGSITVTFRSWKRAQAKVGGQYRIAGMLIEATNVAQVEVGDITEADARRAGADGLATLLKRLGQAEGSVWRVDFRLVGADDRIERRENVDLSADQIQAILGRLQRMDRGGSWTSRTLHLINRYPGVVSTTLASRVGQERAVFKLNVRKLKELGLTESLDTGYRLSPLGQIILNAL